MIKAFSALSMFMASLKITEITVLVGALPPSTGEVLTTLGGTITAQVTGFTSCQVISASSTSI